MRDVRRALMPRSYSETRTFRMRERTNLPGPKSACDQTIRVASTAGSDMRAARRPTRAIVRVVPAARSVARIASQRPPAPSRSR